MSSENLREEIKLVLKQIPQDIHKYLNHPNDAPTYDDYINRILSRLRSQIEQMENPHKEETPPGWSDSLTIKQGKEYEACEQCRKDILSKLQ